MKNKLFFGFVFLFVFCGTVKSNRVEYGSKIEIGDTLTVLAKSGLILRNEPSKDAQGKGRFKFGDKVVVLSKGVLPEIIENRTGAWIKINSEIGEGYLFSGYVTKLKIPVATEKDYDCFYLNYFEKIYRANFGKLICETQYEDTTAIDEKLWERKEWELFENGDLIVKSYGYESYDISLDSDKMERNDLLNLLEWYIFKLKEKDCVNQSIKKEYTVELDEKNQSLSCKELQLWAEYSLGKYRVLIGYNY